MVYVLLPIWFPWVRETGESPGILHGCLPGREKSGFSLILSQILEKSAILNSADEKLKPSTSKNGGCRKNYFLMCVENSFNLIK